MNVFSPEVPSPIFFKIDRKFQLKAKNYILAYNAKYTKQKTRMLNYNLVNMNEFFDQRITIAEGESSDEDSESVSDNSAKRMKKQFKEEKEEGDDGLVSSSDEEEKKNKQKTRKAKKKAVKIKKYLKEKENKGSAGKTVEFVNLFAVGDDNKINVDDVQS